MCLFFMAGKRVPADGRRILLEMSIWRKGGVLVRRFQDEVRIAFTKYALVPVFIIALACVVFALLTWNRSVLERNNESRTLAAEVLTGIITDYEERADAVAAHGYDFAQLRSSRQVQMEFYTSVYREVNITHDNTSFFLLDAERNIVLSNRAELPQHLRAGLGNWGILHRLRLAPEQAQAEFAKSEHIYEQDLVVGRALQQDGQISGYIVFVIPGKYLRRSIYSPYVLFAVANAYDYVPIATTEIFSDEDFQKLRPRLHGAAGLVEVEKQHFYASYEELLDGQLRLYAFSPVGTMLTQYATGAGILLSVLLIMIPIIIVSVRRETRRKMEAMDKLVAAITSVQQGDLQHPVEIHTGNEFEIIGDAYNRMVKSLANLMSINEQKARAAVVSEMRQLESQFNPHFLFNTLENIKFMVRLEPDAAVRMIMDLSALLRYSINNEKQRVTLREDLKYLRYYIEIQQYRFGRRLVYEEDIAAAAMDCLVPKLVLQPLIENAMKYGADAAGDNRIRTEIRCDAAGIHGVVTDNGTGISEETLKRLRVLLASEENSSVHTGVYNIHRRIQLLYGRRYGLEISCPPTGGTQVRFSLPAVEKEEKD